MLSFNIGVSALDASQQAIDVIGQNLANANTPGYQQQRVDLAANRPVQVGELQFGTGVQVTDVQQLSDSLLQNAITANTSDASNSQLQLNTLNQLQAAFGSGTATLGGYIGDFFNQVQQLAADPTSDTQRQVVLSSASTMTGEFNSLAGSISTLQSGLDTQGQQIVGSINSAAQQVAQLNGQIQNATARGISPNDQIDQRNQLVNQIAQYAGVQVVPQSSGAVNLIAGGTALVVGNQANSLAYSVSSDDQGVVTSSGSTTPLSVTDGQLGGLLSLRNQTLPGVLSSLNTLAGQIAQQVDNVQATGLGLNGASTLLSSTRPVSSVSAPLSQAGLALPPQAGTLYVTVTNQATGAQSTTPVNIDPAAQSLQDVAAALSAVPNVQAVTNAQTGELQVQAAAGYTFDFAGQTPTSPSTAGITGTTVPTLGGAYTGSNNDNYSFQVVGSGTVGVSSGLGLQVTDRAGGVVATLNIGQGYSPGSTLTVANGVTVQLSSGTANNGDTFSAPVVAQPDTSGILTALGLGTFFDGSNAADIGVQPALTNDPSLLAGSRTGQPGDASNFTRMAALADATPLAGGTQTFSQNYDAIAGNLGTQISKLGNLNTSQTALGQQLQTENQSVSGVDTNQQMVSLLSSQQAFEMASQYISAVNQSLIFLIQTL
jgi:flagellar hook-associated protein 1 FlgK